MVAPAVNPQSCWEFQGEILVLHHPTTISTRYQVGAALVPVLLGVVGRDPGAAPPDHHQHQIPGRCCLSTSPAGSSRERKDPGAAPPDHHQHQIPGHCLKEL